MNQVFIGDQTSSTLYFIFLSVSCSFLIGFKCVLDDIKMTNNKDVEKEKEYVEIESLMWSLGEYTN